MDVHRPTPEQRTGVFAQAAAFAVLGAAVILFLELLKSHQSQYYSPINASEFFGVVMAFGCYCIMLLLPCYGALYLLRLTQKTFPYTLIIGVLTFGLVLLLLLLLGFFREDLAPVSWRGVVVGLTLLFLVGGLFVHFGRVSWRSWTFSWGGALFIGMLTQSAVVAGFIFHDQRAALCTGVSLLWGFVAGIGFLVLTNTPSRFRTRITLLVLWVVITCSTPLITSEWLNGGLRFSAARPDKPNLLFITCDALRADVCSTYGGETPTPAFDALAQQGVSFNNAYSLAPWTLPSMTGLFLSDYPPGMTPGGPKEAWLEEMTFYECNPPGKTLAESLQAQGYATTALLGNSLLKNHRGFTRGFDKMISYNEPHILVGGGRWARMIFFHAALASCAPTLAPSQPIDITRMMTWHARSVVRRNRHTNFFLWIHYFDPHTPNDPPQRFRSQEGAWPYFAPGMHESASPLLDVFNGLEIAPEEKAYVQSLYRGEVQYVDECIGALLGELDVLRLRDRSYVCLTSDHGEQLWDHGEYFHGQSVYDEEIHVPLIFTGPDIESRVIDATVSCIDLMPTLAALMDVTPDASWRGESLKPSLIEGSTASPDRPCFAQATHLLSWPSPLQMVRDGNYKLIRETDTTHAQLYNLLQDPLERTDIATEHQDEVTRLMGLLDHWVETIQVTLVKVDAADDSRIQDIQEQLQALGYME